MGLARTAIANLTRVVCVDRFVAFMITLRSMLTQRIKIHGGLADEAALEIASTNIVNGNVISVPTDTFYALAADPFNLMAVEQISRSRGGKVGNPCCS
jgi:hypothetical protein